MQHPTALSFLLLVYARYSNHSNRDIHCDNVVAKPSRLVDIAKGQVNVYYNHQFTRFVNVNTYAKQWCSQKIWSMKSLNNVRVILTFALMSHIKYLYLKRINP